MIHSSTFRILCAATCCLLLALPSPGQAAAPMPKVALIGDSIRIGYAPVVTRLLSGRAAVISVEANGGDSGNVLHTLEEWVIREKPDVVHFNAGLHDLKVSRQTREYQVPVEVYRRNLLEIIGRIRRETSASIIFASTTPIFDARHALRGAGFDRFEMDVARYNGTAISAMKGVSIRTWGTPILRKCAPKCLRGLPAGCEVIRNDSPAGERLRNTSSDPA
jgi:hypothetical protein